MGQNKRPLTDRRKIALLFRNHRLRIRFTRAKLAREIGITASRVGRIERAETEISAAEWFAFCKIARISPDVV